MSAAGDEHSPIRGFLAGTISGVTKLVVGHPFDTIKVRLQTNPAFTGPYDCLRQTLVKEGIRGVYKGATPPLVGWAMMDSVMLGSLHNYRELLRKYVYNGGELPTVGHAIAGTGAGVTVSMIAAPIEHVKARLQVQYDAKSRVYTGPIDCAMKLYKGHGIAGVWKGLYATMIFRSFFAVWWGTYDLYSRWFRDHTSMTPGAINFWAGGLSAQTYWFFAFPSDVVKQRIMTDSLTNPRFVTWRSCAKEILAQNGWRGFYRGFLPSFLRAFPTNAAALFMFETTMRGLKGVGI